MTSQEPISTKFISKAELLRKIKPFTTADLAEVRQQREIARFLRASYNDRYNAFEEHIPNHRFLTANGILVWREDRPNNPHYPYRDTHYAIPVNDQNEVIVGEPSDRYWLTSHYSLGNLILLPWFKKQEDFLKYMESIQSIKEAAWAKRMHGDAELCRQAELHLVDIVRPLIAKAYSKVVRERMKEVEKALVTDPSFAKELETEISIEKTQASLEILKRIGELRDVCDLVSAGIKKGQMSLESIERYSKVVGELGTDRLSITGPLRRFFATGSKKKKR